MSIQQGALGGVHACMSLGRTTVERIRDEWTELAGKGKKGNLQAYSKGMGGRISGEKGSETRQDEIGIWSTVEEAATTVTGRGSQAGEHVASRSRPI